MKIDWLLIAITISFMLMPLLMRAQDISTDRPDQANTPVLVPKGSLQVETGFNAEINKFEKRIDYSYNNSLLKFGVNENFEARFAISYFGIKKTHESQPVQKGFGPIAVGFKIKLSEEKNGWPQAALITHLTLKTGALDLRPAFTTTDVTLAVSRGFGNNFAITFNGGITMGETAREALWLYALSASYGLTDQLSFFLESYGFIPELNAPRHLLDAGITFKITPRIQFDASGGIGIKNIKSQLISTGVSARLFK